MPIVTTESLDALAVTVFTEIVLQDNGTLDLDEETPSNATYHLLKHVFPEHMDTEEHRTADQGYYVSGFGQGVEFGLAVAAAIVTQGSTTGPWRKKYEPSSSAFATAIGRKPSRTPHNFRCTPNP